MKPRERLAQTTTAEGRELSLFRRGEDFFIYVDGAELMSSRTHGSEEALARLGIAAVAAEPKAVLVGGLGMGFTLRAVLDQLAGQVRITVAEVFPEVVSWNRSWLAPLAGEPLADPRATVRSEDVSACLDPRRYDLILLDVDNGPSALTLAANRQLYEAPGLRRLREALRPGGAVAIWSAAADDGFLQRLQSAGFAATAEQVRARQSAKGARHTIFIGQRR